MTIQYDGHFLFTKRIKGDFILKRNIEREAKFAKLLQKKMVGPPNTIGFYAIVEGEIMDKHREFVIGEAKDRQEAEDNANEFLKLNNIKNCKITGIYRYA